MKSALHNPAPYLRRFGTFTDDALASSCPTRPLNPYVFGDKWLAGIVFVLISEMGL